MTLGCAYDTSVCLVRPDWALGCAYDPSVCLVRPDWAFTSKQAEAGCKSLLVSRSAERSRTVKIGFEASAKLPRNPKAPALNCDDLPEAGIQGRPGRALLSRQGCALQNPQGKDEQDWGSLDDDGVLAGIDAEMRSRDDVVSPANGNASTPEDPSASALEVKDPLVVADNNDWPLPREAEENWEFCELSSIASSWLPLEGAGFENDLFSEDGIVFVESLSVPANTPSPKPLSFAERMRQSADQAPARPIRHRGPPLAIAKRKPKTLELVMEEGPDIDEWELSGSARLHKRAGHRFQR